MAIPDGYKENFKTLTRAFANGDAALMEVRERATGKTRYAVCAIAFDGEVYAISPFAMMVDGNPFELFDPPNPDGGFCEKGGDVR